MADTPSIKIVVLGEGGVGKSTFVKRYDTGEFTRPYEPTRGVSVFSLPFYTSAGTINGQIWDTAGQEKLGGLRDGYYINASGALLFFDVTSRDTYKKAAVWYRDLIRVAGNIPVILVGNKVDVKDRKVKSKQVTFHRKKNITYVEMSAKSNYNIEKPFLYLLKLVLGDRSLHLVEQVPVNPPLEPELSAEDKQRLEEEFEWAARHPLPPSDDEDEDHAHQAQPNVAYTYSPARSRGSSATARR